MVSKGVIMGQGVTPASRSYDVGADESGRWNCIYQPTGSSKAQRDETGQIYNYCEGAGGFHLIIFADVALDLSYIICSITVEHLTTPFAPQLWPVDS